MVELDGVVLRIEVNDGVGADAGMEHEIIVTKPADRNRHGPADIHGRVLRVGDSDAVGLRQRLAGGEVDLIAAEIEVETERGEAVALGQRIEGESAEIAGAFGRDRCGLRVGADIREGDRSRHSVGGRYRFRRRRVGDLHAAATIGRDGPDGIRMVSGQV